MKPLVWLEDRPEIVEYEGPVDMDELREGEVVQITVVRKHLSDVVDTVEEVVDAMEASDRPTDVPLWRYIVGGIFGTALLVWLVAALCGLGR